MHPQSIFTKIPVGRPRASCALSRHIAQEESILAIKHIIHTILLRIDDGNFRRRRLFVVFICPKGGRMPIIQFNQHTQPKTLEAPTSTMLYIANAIQHDIIWNVHK